MKTKLLAQIQLRPSEMKRLGNRVTYFNDGRPAMQAEIKAFIALHGGQVYTGLHSETDWSRVYWWSKGWHLVNRTGDYAVVR